jgi:RNA polymerase sigma factor (sigma-70 family)
VLEPWFQLIAKRNMPSSSETSDAVVADLMRRVRQFDADAWADLVRLGSPWVYGWCRRAGVQPQEAAEIVQRVFDGVSRAIGNFRREVNVDGLKDWWWSVTRNKLKAHYRQTYDEATARERLDQLPVDLPEDPGPAAHDAFDGEPELQAALTQLLEIGRDPVTHERRLQERKSRHKKT